MTGMTRAGLSGAQESGIPARSPMWLPAGPGTSITLPGLKLEQLGFDIVLALQGTA